MSLGLMDKNTRLLVEWNEKINAVKYYRCKINELFRRKWNSLELKKQSYDGLYRQMVYIAQKPHIFTTTIQGKRNAHWRVYGWKVWASLEKRTRFRSYELTWGRYGSRRWWFKSSGRSVAARAFARGLMSNQSLLAGWSQLQLRWKRQPLVLKPILEDKSVTVLWVTHCRRR